MENGKWKMENVKALAPYGEPDARGSSIHLPSAGSHLFPFAIFHLPFSISHLP